MSGPIVKKWDPDRLGSMVMTHRVGDLAALHEWLREHNVQTDAPYAARALFVSLGFLVGKSIAESETTTVDALALDTEGDAP